MITFLIVKIVMYNRLYLCLHLPITDCRMDNHQTFILV